jgi:hypothetical protein
VAGLPVRLFGSKEAVVADGTRNAVRPKRMRLAVGMPLSDHVSNRYTGTVRKRNRMGREEAKVVPRDRSRRLEHHDQQICTVLTSDLDHLEQQLFSHLSVLIQPARCLPRHVDFFDACDRGGVSPERPARITRWRVTHERVIRTQRDIGNLNHASSRESGKAAQSARGRDVVKLVMVSVRVDDEARRLQPWQFSFQDEQGLVGSITTCSVVDEIE